MKKDPAALFFISDWLTATKGMRADTKGWYLNLILFQFDMGDLPNDIEELANLCDVRFSEYETFKQVWEQVLKQKFKQNENGRLENDRASEIIKRREVYKDKRKKSGVIGYVIKVAINELNATEDEIEHLKSTVNFEELDIKNKQVLKQVLKQIIKLYRNGNRNRNNNDNSNKYSNEVLQLNEFAKKFFEEKYVGENSADTFDKLIRIDGYTPTDIATAIKKARDDPFWDKNFLSPVKLRDKDKNGVYYIDRFLKLKSDGNNGQIMRPVDEKRKREILEQFDNGN